MKSGARRAGWLLLAVAVLASLWVATRPDAKEESVEQRVQRVASELRCPTCQVLSVADSPSETARLIRTDIRTMIERGATDADIEQQYVERYGEWVLLQPERKGLSAIIWWLPALMIMSGMALLVWRIRSRSVVAGGDDADTDRRVARAREALGQVPAHDTQAPSDTVGSAVTERHDGPGLSAERISDG